MIATVVSCFNNYDIRLKYVEDILIKSGYAVNFIFSDFDHLGKRRYKLEKENTVQINVKDYKKNLSLARVVSHLQFSDKSFDKLKEINPDLIYAIVPPNSLVKKIYKYKKAHEKTKIIYDVFDLWPESLPTQRLIKKLLFYWKNLRNKHLKNADTVFTECEYYKRFLPKRQNYVTAYLCKPKREIVYSQDYDCIKFIYLGSINNLIDIDAIVNFLALISKKKPIRLDIVGKGERTADFENSLSAAGIPYMNYGAIYNDEEKDKIISKCHFGINMYKSGLCIGLTMKSLEYFCRGLPIVNAHIFDTHGLVERYSCGINVDSRADDLNFFADFNRETWLSMHSGAKKAYDENFSENIYEDIIKNNI